MESLQGHFLIAATELQDPNFRQTVVLLVQHNDEGALGLVLNRPSDITVKQVWEKVGDSPCVTDHTLLVGGPCQGPLMSVHTKFGLGDQEVMPGVYFSTQSDSIEKLVARDDEAMRFFVGFAGWSPGQLESELETGSWRTMEATAEQIFAAPSDLWIMLTRHAISSTLISTLRIKHVPSDPSLN